MSERVVVLGKGGMVGTAWVETLARAGLEYRAFTRQEFDLGDPDAVQQIEPGTSLVVNCAAYTEVDKAEVEAERADLVNGHAVGALAERCRALGARLIHYSTDYVFDGRGTRPYPIDSVRAPINAYGRSKLLGERLLESSGARVLLIRTSWVYAERGKNFVLTIANALGTKPELRVVSDQRGRPTSARALAENSLRLAAATDTGTFHLTDGGECSWFEFAREIARCIGSATPITPCSSAEFPRPAQRPAYSVLDLSSSEALLGPLEPWPSALAKVLARRG